jgi:hypothetical protein
VRERERERGNFGEKVLPLTTVGEKMRMETEIEKMNTHCGLWAFIKPVNSRKAHLRYCKNLSVSFLIPIFFLV